MIKQRLQTKITEPISKVQKPIHKFNTQYIQASAITNPLKITLQKNLILFITTLKMLDLVYIWHTIIYINYYNESII